MSKVLILLGKGRSRHEMPGIIARHSSCTGVWTQNDYERPETTLHFDVHDDPPQAGNMAARARLRPEVPVVVSPFLQPPRFYDVSFPIDAIYATWGRAYFELSVDFMIAYALYQRKLGKLDFDVLAMPGHNFNSAVHFFSRGGAHYWLGAAEHTEGLKLELPAESFLLQRAVPRFFAVPHLIAAILRIKNQPHMYGHGPERTEPLTSRYRWLPTAQQSEE